MGKFFTDKYQEYYDKLADSHSISTQTLSLQSMVSEVTAEYSAIYNMIDELQGEFTAELYGSIQGLKDELAASSYVLDDLKSTVVVMEDLGSSVTNLRDQDTNYEDKEEELKKKKEEEPIIQIVNGITTHEYSVWKHDIKVIRESIERLINICVKLQGTCDRDIALIDSFNSAIIDLRLKLVAFAASGGNTTIEDIQKMTLEDKQEYLQRLLDQLAENYNNYKKAYEDALNTLHEYSPETRSALKLVIKALGPSMGIDFDDFNGIFDGDDPVAQGMHLINYIKGMNKNVEDTDKTYMECFLSYFSGEKSFKDSGMLAIVEKSGQYSTCADRYYVEQGDLPEEEFIRVLENQFRNSILTGDAYKSLQDEDLRKSISGLLNLMFSTEKTFEDNYEKQLKVGVMIKGTRKLKESLVYDDIRLNDEDYSSYVYDNNPDNLFAGIDDLADACLDDKNLQDLVAFIYDDSRFPKMTDNERKMMTYLCSSGKYDQAIEYKKIIDDGVNMREGTLRAQELYQDVLNGGGVLSQAAVDDLRAAWEGSKKGVSGYAGGLLNLLDPETEPSENDYYYMELTKLFKQDVYKLQAPGNENPDNTRYTAEQTTQYLEDQGYDPLCPTTMELSSGGYDANIFGLKHTVDLGFNNATVKASDEILYVDASGNEYSTCTYNPEYDIYLSPDGIPVVQAPTFTDGKETHTLAGWESKGYDTVLNKTYGTGEDAIEINMDTVYKDTLNNSFKLGEKVTTTTIKFIEDKIAPGLGTLSFAASDAGNAIKDTVQSNTKTFNDLTDGSVMDNSSNTHGAAALEYVSDFGNNLSLAGDIFGGLGKISKAVGGGESALASFCGQAEGWVGNVNSAYNLPETVKDAAKLHFGSGAEKLVKSLTGKDMIFTYNSAYKKILKSRFK